MNNAAENNTQKNNNGISQKDDRCCKLSVVVSVYNEEKALREFYKETNKILEQIKKSGWDVPVIKKCTSTRKWQTVMGLLPVQPVPVKQ